MQSRVRICNRGAGVFGLLRRRPVALALSLFTACPDDGTRLSGRPLPARTLRQAYSILGKSMAMLIFGNTMQPRPCNLSRAELQYLAAWPRTREYRVAPPVREGVRERKTHGHAPLHFDLLRSGSILVLRPWLIQCVSVERQGPPFRSQECSAHDGPSAALNSCKSGDVVDITAKAARVCWRTLLSFWRAHTVSARPRRNRLTTSHPGIRLDSTLANSPDSWRYTAASSRPTQTSILTSFDQPCAHHGWELFPASLLARR